MVGDGGEGGLGDERFGDAYGSEGLDYHDQLSALWNSVLSPAAPLPSLPSEDFASSVFPVSTHGTSRSGHQLGQHIPQASSMWLSPPVNPMTLDGYSHFDVSISHSNFWQTPSSTHGQVNNLLGPTLTFSRPFLPAPNIGSFYNSISPITTPGSLPSHPNTFLSSASLPPGISWLDDITFTPPLRNITPPQLTAMSPITTPASWSSNQNSPLNSGYLSHGTDGFDNLVFSPSPHIVSPQQTVFHSYFALDSNNLETPTTDIEDKHPHINISESSSLDPQRFHCDVSGCTRHYKRKHELSRHIKVHSGTKPHGCTVSSCNRSGQRGFTRRDHLRQHLRKVHGMKL